jgi:hypothetical protein
MTFWKTDKRVKEAVDKLNELMGDEEKLVIAITFASVQELIVLVKGTCHLSMLVIRS